VWKADGFIVELNEAACAAAGAAHSRQLFDFKQLQQR
jgi:hypothetical protein